MDDIRDKAIIGTDDTHALLEAANRLYLTKHLQTKTIPKGIQVRTRDNPRQQICSNDAMQYLRWILSGVHENALAEWLRCTFISKQYVRCDVLIRLLTFAQWQPHLQRLVVSLIGSQGFTAIALLDRQSLEWVYETQPLDRAIWLKVIQQVHDSMVETLQREGLEQERFYALYERHTNGATTIESEAAHLNNLIRQLRKDFHPVLACRKLRRRMFDLPCDWTEALSDVFWSHIHCFDAMSYRYYEVLKIYNFRSEFIYILQQSAYYLHPSDQNIKTRISTLQSISKSEKRQLLTHITKLYRFRRAMRDAIIGQV